MNCSGVPIVLTTDRIGARASRALAGRRRSFCARTKILCTAVRTCFKKGTTPSFSMSTVAWLLAQQALSGAQITHATLVLEFVNTI